MINLSSKEVYGSEGKCNDSFDAGLLSCVPMSIPLVGGYLPVQVAIVVAAGVLGVAEAAVSLVEP